jgi:AcrR family transcriptional regulator
MEAATTQPRDLSGDKAQRIIEAMRASVATRGVEGSTFDHVAREAGVSRGLLHYYFGTKEALLVEVVRRDSDIRMAVLDAALRDVRSTEDVLNGLVRSLEDLVENDPEFLVLIFELFVLSRRNEDVAGELRELFRRTRDHVTELLEAKEREGVIRLKAGAQGTAAVIFALGDGIAMRMLTEPGAGHSDVIEAAMVCGRALLGD